jgi:hypothetical protein
MIRAALFLLVAGATTAGAQSDAYDRTQGGALLDSYKLLVGPYQAGLPEGPKIIVIFDNPFAGTVLRDAELRLAVEWTINGERQSSDLWGQGARCTSGAEVFCSALTSFRTPRNPSGTPVHPEEFSQGFYLPNLESDTRYCFRFQATAIAPEVPGVSSPVAPWSVWTCHRTPPAPPPVPLPPAPLQPLITILPATDGRGVPGGPLPTRALIEWELPDQKAADLVARFVIQRAWLTTNEPSWEGVELVPGGVRETTLAFEAGQEPTDQRRFLFRVCAQNVTGRRCSPARATSPFTAGPLAPKSTRPSPFPAPPADVVDAVTPDAATPRAPTRSICDLARQARARNSPAAPGLEAKCAAEGGQAAASPPPQPSAPGTVKRQGRVRVEGAPATKPSAPICELARVARARNSPAAPGLEAKCAAESGVASGTSDGPVAAVAPENVISVRVMYPRAYGYKGSSNAFGSIGPTSCNAFSVTADLMDAAARPRNPIRVSSDGTMTESGASYVCTYQISQVPLDQATLVNVAVLNDDLFARWEGSSGAQPPAGEVRTILDATRTTTLSARQPRARLVFEMIYAAPR